MPRRGRPTGGPSHGGSAPTKPDVSGRRGLAIWPRRALRGAEGHAPRGGQGQGKDGEWGIGCFRSQSSETLKQVIELGRRKLFQSPSRGAEDLDKTSGREAVDTEEMTGNDIELNRGELCRAPSGEAEDLGEVVNIDTMDLSLY